MAFSTNGGGTLTLPSPTTASIHGDPPPSVRSLRRSLSRSPSRFHLMRSESHNTRNPESAAASPCPLPHTTTPAHLPPPAPSMSASSSISSFSSVSSIASSTDYHLSASTPRPTVAASAPPTVHPAANLFSTPLRSGMKLSLRSARPKTTSAKPVSRPRASPKSPLKRALSSSSDLGNAAPSPAPQAAGPPTALSEPLLGQENSSSSSIGGGSKFSSLLLALGSSPRTGFDRPSRHSMHLDLSGDARLDALASVMASPLKRSDGVMNLDQTNPGSPVAKRRSLHGISSLGADFNVFDFASPAGAPPARAPFKVHDDASSDLQPRSETGVTSAPVPPPQLRPVDPAPPSPAPVVTKRTSSLRKSTLQQRHDPRSSWGRRQGEKYLAQQHQQQQQQLLQQQQQQQPQQQGSPLPQLQQPKRASNEWLFTAPHVRSRPRASLDQLLKPEPRESPFKVKGPLPNPSAHPAGAPSGPPAHQPHPLSRTLTTSSSGSSLPEDSPTHFPVQLPPDRPRPASIFARSLPLNAHRPKPDLVATPQYKSARPLQSVFASAGLVSKMNQSTDDESLQRGGAGGRPMIMPDTPCKKQVYPSNTYPPSSGSGRKQHQRRFFFSGAPETPFSSSAAQTRGASAKAAGESVVNFFKLRSSHTRTGSILSLDGDASDSQGAADGFDLPPTPTKSVLAKNLFGSASKGVSSPIAIRDVAATGPASFTPEAAAPRQPPSSFSSPVGSSSSEKMSPKTPREHSILHSVDFTTSMAPPDASRLSISTNSNAAPRAALSRRSSAIFPPPATPTTDREAFINFVDRRVSITPVHGAAPTDADAVLSSMFGKVECVGKGEFSQVYRVNARDGSVANTGPLDYFSATPSKRTAAHAADGPAASAPTVFAVKKVRLPYFGQKEREAKLREVAVLEAVRDRENVLQIFDHWEQNGHLYIQTEFCDEGGLDSFLKKVGEHGRLDDFRIWKILLEVSQGLRYVHDAGFIHLDLKPANVFVTYEGHLKIGDFGMATSWPAPKGIEGEGDREYMGPEILEGKYDKPADIFALGLIVLEIACNVFLPDNGPIWVALREGDMSVVPSLTTGEANALVRDSAGMPVLADFDTSAADSHGLTASLDLASTTPGRHSPVDFRQSMLGGGRLFGALAKKPIGLEHPPAFMASQADAGSLDAVVAGLISPDPAQRPTVHELLAVGSLQWVHARRRAPATIFEGNWGPDCDEDGQQPSSELDTEMTDV